MNVKAAPCNGFGRLAIDLSLEITSIASNCSGWDDFDSTQDITRLQDSTSSIFVRLFHRSLWVQTFEYFRSPNSQHFVGVREVLLGPAHEKAEIPSWGLPSWGSRFTGKLRPWGVAASWLAVPSPGVKCLPLWDLHKELRCVWNTWGASFSVDKLSKGSAQYFNDFNDFNVMTWWNAHCPDMPRFSNWDHFLSNATGAIAIIFRHRNDRSQKAVVSTILCSVKLAYASLTDFAPWKASEDMICWYSLSEHMIKPFRSAKGDDILTFDCQPLWCLAIGQACALPSVRRPCNVKKFKQLGNFLCLAFFSRIPDSAKAATSVTWTSDKCDWMYSKHWASVRFRSGLSTQRTKWINKEYK